MSDYIIYNGELYHYGVKGMKWGVRRYQDKHGRLTNKGKQRYEQISAREDTAAKGRHGQAVLAKYETKKTSKQKEADAIVEKEAQKQRDYISNRVKKGLSTDDFDLLDDPKFLKLMDDMTLANIDRATLYAGESWINKYNRELARAIDKDNRERGLY